VERSQYAQRATRKEILSLKYETEHANFKKLPIGTRRTDRDLKPKFDKRGFL